MSSNPTRQSDEQRTPVRRALLSVSDKSGIAELAVQLKSAGVELLSTGGTYKKLHDAGLEVTEVSAHTGSPEIMDGRVKTLHPKIHGGILCRRGVDDEVMAEQQIAPIDLVIVNLYPFRETIAQPGATDEAAIENIDIGGPAMLRAAAKNHRDVWVIVDPNDYELVAAEVAAGGSRFADRRHSALKAYQHTASYDSAVASYLLTHELDRMEADYQASEAIEKTASLVLPETFTQSFTKKMTMRYGENPHQRAAFYVEDRPPAGTIACFEQLQGKALSYNNIADTDAALECVKAFDDPTCVIVKHANPCGVASAESALAAYEGAFATDTTSAFGGIIAFNVRLDGPTLEAILERQFVEVVIAPEVDQGARQVAERKKNVRLLQTGAFAATSEKKKVRDFKRVGGGLLVQDADQTALIESDLNVVSNRTPTASEHADLLFAWKVAWFVKSNAIVYARDQQTIGVGAGQMARVISAKIAAMKAEEEGLTVPGSVMASDAFFPFRDGIDAAAEAGIRAIIQPGGSMRDDEVIAAANERDIAMVFTGMRHFRH